MPSAQLQAMPGLSTFLKSLKLQNVEKAIETFISLLKRRQIRNSRPCAIATAQLLLRVIAAARVRDPAALLERVRKVGQRLVLAQPREMAVGNIVRRVLGLIREVVEDGADSNAADFSDMERPAAPAQTHHKHDSLHRPVLSSHISQFSPLNHGLAIPEETAVQHQSRSTSQSPIGDNRTVIPTRPAMMTTATGTGMTSLFGLLSTPDRGSPTATPPIGATSPDLSGQISRDLSQITDSKVDIKAEVIDGIKELLDELDVVDDQIAAHALEHIHSNEIILTHTSSQTIQRFLLAAARKRKFTVVHVETYPNDHLATHDTIMRGHPKSDDEAVANDDDDARWKPLTAMGINVIMIPDSAVFALMSRVNKVILAPHAVLANGSLIAAAGAQTIAQAAKVHQTPVVVLSGVYKLSPVYPFDTEDLIEYGDPGRVVGFADGDLVENVEVLNPSFDYVDAGNVDLYITNLGGHAPSYLYRIVADHYRVEDINLG